MKRYLTLLLAIAMVLAVVSPAAAARPEIRFPVTFNGHPVLFDVQPEIKDGRSYVPFRAIFEKMGAKIEYEASTQTITAVRGDKTVKLQIGSTTATVNGQSITLFGAPYIKDGRTLVPLRNVGEMFGADVQYDPATTKISIVDTTWPKRGGTLQLAMWNAPQGKFNPSVVQDTYGSYITGMMYDALWRYDERYTPIPAIAEAWEWSENNTKLTYYLRKDVRFFKDGRTLTADDVIFTTKSMMHPKYVGHRNVGWEDVLGYAEYTKGQGNGETAEDFAAGIVTAKPLAGIYKEDDYTVVFKLARPNAVFVLQTGIAPVDRFAYASIPVQDWGTARDPWNYTPNGTGAFKMLDYLEGRYVKLVRNDDYYLGAPYMDAVMFRFVSADVALGEATRGTLDYFQFGANDYEAYQDLANKGVAKIIEYPDMVYQLMNFNTKKGITADRTVRQAIAHAVDRPSIIANLMKGHASTLNSPLHPLTFAYNDNHSYTYQFNPAKARELLDQAGWTLGSDGYRYKDGQKLKLSLMYPGVGNQVRIKTAPVVQQNLKDIGIELELFGYDWPTLLTKTFDQQEFDLFFIGWGLTADPDPTGLWDKASTAPGGNNPSGWWTERSEELIKLGLSTPDIETRMEYYWEFQEIFMRDMPALPLYAANTLVYYNPRVNGVRPGPWGEFWNLNEWWFTDGK